MLHIPKIDDYLEILTDEEVKDFVAINFSEYFKSIREEQNLRKVAKLLYNTKPVIKSQLKELLSELKKFKVHTVLVLDYRNGRKIFHSSTKLTASDSDTDEAFKSMHQSIMTKIKNYACKDYIVLDAVLKLSIKIFEC